MKISIITVAYNAEKTIEDAIQSVLNQTYNNIEYIIVDGKSSDATLDIISKYPEITKVISEPDNGLYDAMNKGIQVASGAVIGILNADDVYANEHVIQSIANTFLSNDCDATYGDLVYVKENDLNAVVRNWKSGIYNEGDFRKGWMPPHPTFFVKKDCLEKHGTFNLDFRTSADYELMLRLIHKHKIRLAYLPELIVRMRVGGQSNASLKNRITANKEDRKAWEVNGLKPGNLTLIRKPLSKIKQFWSK